MDAPPRNATPPRDDSASKLQEQPRANSNATRSPVSQNRKRGRLRRVVRAVGYCLAGVAFATTVAALLGVAKTPIEYPPQTPVVNDVTQLNPIAVEGVVEPTSIEEVITVLRTTRGPVSIGGGRFSMGGQTATEGGVQIDMRKMDKIVRLDSVAKTITVQAGARWRDIQERIDKANLSIKIMQTYSNFTVGGSLSVNVHGRYVGLGPLILSVRAIKLVLADGSLVEASPTKNADLFYGAVGGYGGIGVIVEATLDLADNVRVKRVHQRMPLSEYLSWFRRHVRDSANAVFHNADIYPNDFTTVNAVTYRETQEAVTVPERLIPRDKSYRLNRFVYGVISEWPAGKWIRQHVIDPVLFRGEPVSWRNNEASYDVRDLEPVSREASSYVLQEYFVPVDELETFVGKMRSIFRSHGVNVMNVSIRHAKQDPGSLLAWAREEVFAFVVYYKQGTTDSDRRRVGVWTRELVDAAIASRGAYYLPYQPHPTRAQFARAYPRSAEYFALKARVDPNDRLRNTLWNTYYPPAAAEHGVLPIEERLALDTVSGYRRDEGQTFLTHPEWFIVYSSEEYAEWLRTRLPTDFPYLASIGQFWQAYGEARKETRNAYVFNAGYHVMLWVIGASYSAELTLKALYENTIGRFTGWTASGELTEEDRFAHEVAADYGRFIHDAPWYAYRFAPRVKELWSAVPWWGPHVLRKWERRLFLTVEFGFKALYASLIGVGTKTAYTPQAEKMMMVVGGLPDSVAPAGLTVLRAIDSTHKLVATPRYDGFHRAVVALAAAAPDAVLKEVAGNDDIVVTGVAPLGWDWRMPGVRTLYALALPTDSTHKRVVMQVRTKALIALQRALVAQRGLALDHMYDY